MSGNKTLRIASKGIVTDLTDAPATALHAQVLNADKHSVVLRISRAITLDNAVKLQIDGALILGAVTHCVFSSSENAFVCSIHIAQVIPSLTDLARLMTALQLPARAAQPVLTTDSHDVEQLIGL